MNNKAPRTIEETIAFIRQTQTELKDAQKMYQGVMVAAGWVVRVDKVYLDFDVIDRKVLNARPCRVDRCHLFSKRDAEAIAATTTNGHGTKGEAIHIKDALKDYLHQVELALEGIEA